MANSNIESTEDKYDKLKDPNYIPESILLRIKEWSGVLGVFFEKAFFKIDTKDILKKLKDTINLDSLRNVFKK